MIAMKGKLGPETMAGIITAVLGFFGVMLLVLILGGCGGGGHHPTPVPPPPPEKPLPHMVGFSIHSPLPKDGTPNRQFANYGKEQLGSNLGFLKKRDWLTDPAAFKAKANQYKADGFRGIVLEALTGNGAVDIQVTKDCALWLAGLGMPVYVILRDEDSPDRNRYLQRNSLYSALRPHLPPHVYLGYNYCGPMCYPDWKQQVEALEQEFDGQGWSMDDWFVNDAIYVGHPDHVHIGSQWLLDFMDSYYKQPGRGNNPAMVIIKAFSGGSEPPLTWEWVRRQLLAVQGGTLGPDGRLGPPDWNPQAPVLPKHHRDRVMSINAYAGSCGGRTDCNEETGSLFGVPGLLDKWHEFGQTRGWVVK